MNDRILVGRKRGQNNDFMQNWKTPQPANQMVFQLTHNHQEFKVENFGRTEEAEDIQKLYLLCSLWLIHGAKLTLQIFVVDSGTNVTVTTPLCTQLHRVLCSVWLCVHLL